MLIPAKFLFARIRAVRLMLLSQNALFLEVLSKTLDDCQDMEVLSPSPNKANDLIQANAPEIIIIDETLPSPMIEQIMKNACSQETCKVLLVNPNQNDLVTLHTHRSSMRNANDLLDAIIPPAAKV